MAKIIATGLGVGFFPYAPGTWGSILGFFLALGLHYGLGLEGLALGVIGFTVVGYLSCRALVANGTISEGTDIDPSEIVIDEIAGMALALCLISAYRGGFFHPEDPLIAFGLFRFFDILKPGPIGWIETWSQKKPQRYALGIMIDDLLAGVCAFAVQVGLIVGAGIIFK